VRADHHRGANRAGLDQVLPAEGQPAAADQGDVGGSVYSRENRERVARLLPRADGLGRVPAVEVLVATNYIRDCIENKDKTKYIVDAIKAGTSQYGMQTFDQSLYQLYRSGLITLDEAIRRSTNPNEFKLRIQGVQSTSDLSQEVMDGSLQAPDRLNPLGEESPFDFSNQP